jgi:hypothetical protein
MFVDELLGFVAVTASTAVVFALTEWSATWHILAQIKCHCVVAAGVMFAAMFPSHRMSFDGTNVSSGRTCFGSRILRRVETKGKAQARSKLGTQ